MKYVVITVVNLSTELQYNEQTMKEVNRVDYNYESKCTSRWANQLQQNYICQLQ